MKTLLIMGSGQMGCGIAQVALLANYHVTMKDPSPAQLEKAKKHIEQGFDKRVSKEQMSADKKHQLMQQLTYTTDMSDKKFDVLIEAIPENKQLKVQVLQDMAKLAHKTSLVATNTSSLSITELSVLSGLQGKLVGIHFMNPVPVMPLVELIGGMLTEDAVLKNAQEFIEELGKTCVKSADRPGFLVNRILIPMINEAIFALYEGVGSVQDIDNAMKLGANQPMGPLQLADFIGLDTCLSIMNVLYDGFKDSKYRPCPLLVSYVQAGRLGKKSGQGFYPYEA